MRIENLNVRYFGRKSNLLLDDLSNRMNVVYGPNGSGKSTTIQFIRWMLFGNCDTECERHMRETTGRSEGGMTVFHDGLRRTIARQDDGSRYGLVSLDGGDRFTQQTNHMVSLLGEINQTDFDQLYAPKFEEEHDVYGLLRNAQARGLELSGQRISHPRVPELRLKIDNIRRDMDRLPWRANDLHSLVEQKRSLESRISMLEDEYRRRRLDYDREYQEINRQAQDLEVEIGRIREQWHAKDDQVSVRRRELEAAWRAAEEAKQEYVRQRREELASIEANIGRARAMQGEVRNRYERVDTDLRNHDLELSQASPTDTTACLVNSIAQQLDQIRRVPQSVYDATTGRYLPATSADATIVEAGQIGVSNSSSTTGATEFGPHAVPSLDSLRAEVGQLCRTLQENQSGHRATALSQEILQLQQCDSGMENWLATLTQQRDQIAEELERAQRHGVSLVSDTAHGDVWNHRGTIAGEIARPDRVKAVPHACDSYEPIEPESDVLLRRLTGERDVLARELEASERRLRQLLDRRRELETAIGRVSDQELEATRREVLEIEGLIRVAEERDRMQRDIERLEDELRRTQDGFAQSSIVQQASETLRRLSLNRFIAMSIDGMGGITVEDDAGRSLPFGQLGQGPRDQIYLSLVLALVAAYRTRGVELPLILNDVFSHIDSERDDATAAVLNDFTRNGHQVILFTRHRHVAQLFEPFKARYLELESGTPVSAPVEPEVIEAVRFRPRDEDPSIVRATRTTIESNRAKYDRPVTVTNIPVAPIHPANTTVAGSEASLMPSYERAPVAFAPACESQSGRVPVRPYDEPIQSVRTVEDANRAVEEVRVREHLVDESKSYQGTRPKMSSFAASHERRQVPGDYQNVTLSNEGSDIRAAASASVPNVARRDESHSRQPVEHVASAHTETFRSYTESRPPSTTSNRASQPAGYALSRSTSLEHTGIIDADVVSRLRALAIVSVDDFLNASPAKIDRDLQSWGLSTRPVRRWQDELVLRCSIPGLNANEARLLVAAGVADVQVLADCEADTLTNRLLSLLSSRAGRGAPTFQIDLARVVTWVTTARRRASSYQRSAPTQWSSRNNYPEAHDTDSTFDPESTGGRSGRTRKRDASAYDNVVENEIDNDWDEDDDDFDARSRSRFEDTGILGASSNTDRGDGGGGSSRSSRSSRSSSSTSNRSSSRSSSEHQASSGSARSRRRSSDGSSSSSAGSRTARGARTRSSNSERSEREPRGDGERRTTRKPRGERESRKDRERKLRFYLDRNDPVVDAPSIGSRTAERLGKAGIRTVKDLLSIDPETAAAQIDYRRINADTIREWQSQAILCCRIPMLRGHDSQILVACGVTDPEKIAQMDAATLWGIVQPYTKTAECKRIIRNGRTPDPEEIQDWIDWAKSSRALHAA